MFFSALPEVNFSQNESNCLQIYAPEISEEIVATNDVVELISPTSFKFLGRIDHVINTGGVKVHPEAVEEKLSLHITKPFFIASEKDDALGEKVILIIESEKQMQLKDFSEVFELLSGYEKPKKIYTSSQFVYTKTGKVKRMATIEIIKKE
jgi:O-succinylbenzoic acid--CoA ligase